MQHTVGHGQSDNQPCRGRRHLHVRRLPFWRRCLPVHESGDGALCNRRRLPKLESASRLGGRTPSALGHTRYGTSDDSAGNRCLYASGR